MVTETKLYDQLGIKPDASQDDIKKAYRKGALNSRAKVSQAYEILSDPEKRKTYDQYGLDFILHGGPPPPDPSAGGGFESAGGFGGMPGGMPGGFGGMGGMPGGGRTFHFSTSGGGGGGGFNFSDPNSIFSEFLRGGGAGMGGMGGGGGGGGMGGEDDDIFSSFGGAFGGGRPGAGSRARPSMNGMRRPAEPEVTVLEKPLPVTLEELFNGTTKKMKIKRKTYDPATGKQATQDRILEVPIKKGLKAGSKIKFTDVGDQVEGGTQDLHFVVTEKEHPLFKREGDDIRATVEIDLKEALTGWKRTVQTIDGKQLPVSSSGPTQPTYEERFPGLGMPKSKQPTVRGDFIVGVKIKFPTSLTPQQKAQLREIL
ncbi:hypothetical protein B0A49_00217 [Cryomyces minteri]|uniref:J domain-containing protein n=1 Tax=Cryomyces minteri TaxID=331657 RepID=A0A4U0XZW3_9PEZI|nr:hypothetical protein B0A49_00217 [Cryomyces minteri]